jgi:hypothetical protein
MQQTNPTEVDATPMSPQPRGTSAWKLRAGPALAIGIFAVLLLSAGPAMGFASVGHGAPAPVGQSASATPATTQVVHTGFLRLSQFSAPTLLSGGTLPGLAGAIASSSDLKGPTPLGHVEPRTATSTASNWEVANSSNVQSIAEVGGSNQTLILASPSTADLDNGSITLTGLVLTPSVYFFKYGYSTIYRSTDGGQAWGTTWVPLESAWQGSGAFLSGTTGTGVSNVVANGSGGASGATAYGLEGFEQACIVDFEFQFIGDGNCTSTAKAAGPAGLAITQSSNGGQSWGSPTTIVSADPDPLKPFPAIGACAAGNYYFTGNFTGHANLNYNSADKLLIASWQNESFDLFNFTCINGAAGAEFAETSTLWSSHSSNGGATWSTPGPVSSNVLLNPFAPESASLFTYSSSAIGPAPTYPDYLIWDDWNHSTSTTVPFAFASSTNNGTTWSAASDIGTIGAIPVLSANPAGFLNYTGPVLAADNWSGSPHSGNLYLVWNDNRTSAASGTPSIAFSRSTDGGSTWSAPVYISAADTSSTYYFLPAISVGPTGQLWVDYYGLSTTTSSSGGNPPTASYQVFGVESSDGGLSWTSQFQISDAPSIFIIGSYTNLGGGPSILATNAGAYAAWTDCRGGVSCPGTLLATPSAFVSNLDLLNFSATAPGATATLGYLGTSGTVSLPQTEVWERNAEIQLRFPNWLPDNPNTIYAYQNVSGFENSAANPATLTYPGTGNLVATYTPQPAGWVTGTVGPYTPSLTVTIDSQPVSLAALNASGRQFNLTVAGGTAYQVNVTSNGYRTYSTTVPTVAGKASPISVWLPRVSGWISGKVSPANASLLVNGSTVPVSLPSGSFNYTVPWGTYWVNASETGYTVFSQFVTVSPASTLSVNPTLSGGWLNGSINPISGVVDVNGAPITLHSGNFAYELPGGTYNVTASAHGYSYFQWTYHITAGATTTANIHLSNQGWILGTIGPTAAVASAIVLVAGVRIAVNNAGAFNATEGLGSHLVQVSASGYNESNQTVTVSPGNVSRVTFTLGPVSTKTGCPPTCNTPPGGNGSKSSSSNLLLYVGLGIVIIVVIALVAVLLMRRRPPSASEAEAPSEPAPYDESTVSSGDPPST